MGENRRSRKISIASRLRDLAVGSFGLRDQDILFDPLVLPISTGIEEDRRNAMEIDRSARAVSPKNCPTLSHRSSVSPTSPSDWRSRPQGAWC